MNQPFHRHALVACVIYFLATGLVPWSGMLVIALYLAFAAGRSERGQ